jgi:two-component system response regulator AlgR
VRTTEREYLIEESLTHLENEFGVRFVRLHRNCLVSPAFITGYEKRLNEANEERWVAILKDIPETVAISRRQQHLVRENLLKS